MHWRILGSGIVWFCDTTVDFFLFSVFAKYTEKLAEVGTSIKKGWGKDMGLEFCQDFGLWLMNDVCGMKEEASASCPPPPLHKTWRSSNKWMENRWLKFSSKYLWI